MTPQLRFLLATAPCVFVALLVAQETTAGPALPENRSAAIMLRAFESLLLLEDRGETSANVAIGDLNADGRPDIVLAKGRHWPLHNRILLNDGEGNFPTGQNLAEAPDRTYTAALADLDGTGISIS